MSCLPSNKSSENSAIKFLTLEEALEIHETLIQEFGGPSGVRDLGLLESALFRPRTGYYRDLIEMSVALFESLLMHHPFVDGNRRVAFFAVDIFLRINGYRVVVDPDTAHKTIIKGIEQRIDVKESLDQFLRQHCTKTANF